LSSASLVSALYSESIFFESQAELSVLDTYFPTFLYIFTTQIPESTVFDAYLSANVPIAVYSFKLAFHMQGTFMSVPELLLLVFQQRLPPS
jgi:hypothetical protein